MWATTGQVVAFVFLAVALGVGHLDDLQEEPVMFDRIRAWAQTDPVRRAVRTFIQAFVVLFLVSLTGWLGDVHEWATCLEQCQPFPDPSALGKAAVAAAASAAISTFTLIQNVLEDRGRVRPVLKHGRS